MGNILLSPEGINLFVAGDSVKVSELIEFLRHDAVFEQRFCDIKVKESISPGQPHRRIVVRIKPEIITMKHPMVRSPLDTRAPAVEPTTLKRWLDQGHDDDGREVVLLDTRNNFEIQIGTFNGAVDFGIERFSEFPKAFNENAAPGQSDYLSGKTVVSFCTGGIRCEKAALYMRECDLANVYQLEGGILRYFEEIGGAHYSGECFVFDRRVALDPDLKPTEKDYECTAGEVRQAQYQVWKSKQEQSLSE